MKKIFSLVVASAIICNIGAVCFAYDTNQMVEIDLWNSIIDQPSMGNVATENNQKGLYNAEKNTLQIGTNAVEISGYVSGVVEMLYKDDNGEYVPVNVLTTETISSGTKYDGVSKEVEFLSSFEISLPNYITKSGVEFIEIQMQVPYTPMDEAIGDGYLDSRIRINWNSAEETTFETIVPNPEISSGEVKSFEIESNGIIVGTNTNTLSDVVKLNVEVVTSGEKYEFAKEVLKDIEGFDLYYLEFNLVNEVVTPTGTVSIFFPYSSVEEIYRVNDTGFATTLYGTQSDDNYKISTRIVGLFTIKGEKYVRANVLENFTDLSGHWGYDYIETAVEKGLFSGTSETTFSPNDKMTNEMAITVLYRIAGQPEVEVSGSEWYAKAIKWGYENEIIGEYTDFNIGENVTRELLATMLYRYENNFSENSGDLSKYSDANEVSSWASEAMLWANASGVITGTNNDELLPKNTASRAEVATMFVRYITN